MKITEIGIEQFKRWYDEVQESKLSEITKDGDRKYSFQVTLTENRLDGIYDIVTKVSGDKLKNISSTKIKEELGNGYYRDKNHVYYDGEKLEGVDIETFEIISCIARSCYTKDKNNVYFEREKIDGADPETFEYLGGYYGKDKNNVYYYGEKLKGANPETFEP